MISLSSPPRERYVDAHYFCDYIELLALATNTDEVSISDVINRFYDDDSKGFDQGGKKHSEKSEEWESLVNDWFINLEARQQVYGDAYPFSVRSRKYISLKDNLKPTQHLYLFLLLCSNLRTIKKGRDKLTSDFEDMSKKAFNNYLPSISEIHKFGKSSNQNSRYTGKLEDKVVKFADDIDCPAVITDDFFAENDSGDYGLDIVAWLPLLGDANVKNIQIFLGQCATGKNWLTKQSEPEKIRNAIHGIQKSIIMLFIPYDCRNSDRSFKDKAKITTTLMFDRFRLMTLLQDDADYLSELDSHQLVLDSIDFEEDLVA